MGAAAHRWTGAFLACLAAACDFGPTSRPIETDLSGTWPVSCQRVVRGPANEECSVVALTIEIVQREPGGEGSFEGTRSAATLSCASGTAAVAPSRLRGDYRASAVSMAFGDGDGFLGVLYRPTMSLSLVELRGGLRLSTGDSIAVGECTLGPLETRSR
jgi:hypothetical protein